MDKDSFRGGSMISRFVQRNGTPQMAGVCANRESRPNRGRGGGRGSELESGCGGCQASGTPSEDRSRPGSDTGTQPKSGAPSMPSAASTVRALAAELTARMNSDGLPAFAAGCPDDRDCPAATKPCRSSERTRLGHWFGHQSNRRNLTTRDSQRVARRSDLCPVAPLLES